MNKTILGLIGSLLAVAPVHAAVVSDGAGLKLSLDDGRVAYVELDGERLPARGVGGFYLRQPNGAKKVPMVGNAVSKDGTLQLTLTSPLQAKVSAVLTEGEGFIEVAGELENLTGTDRGLWLGLNLPVNTTGWKWGQTLSTRPVITKENPAYAEGNNLIPIPAVWTDKGGIALCIPPMNPCVFEVGADADGVRIQMAFGLSKDTTKSPSKAPFRVRIYSIDGTWGFRDALAKYYDWYSEYYTIEPWIMKALNHHHDWIGMNYVNDSFKTDRQINPDLKEYMAYNAPHWPLHAPQENIDRCKGRYDAGYDAIRNARYQRQIESGLLDPATSELSEPEYDQPWDELSPEQRNRRIRQMEVYAAMVERLDENIGRLIDLLRKQGRLDDTLILFLSDNGACAETPTKRVRNYSADVPVGGVDSFESYGQGWACVGNTPLRKFKQDSYEGGICTAMIAHWPKGIAAPGRINREPVHLIDIMPTVAALSGAKTPGNAQGISIVPAFNNKPLTRDKDLFWEFGSGQAIRRGDMKLVTHKQKPWELYDLANDRTETRNLAAQMPELVQQLERSWKTWWMDCTGSEYSGKEKKNRQMDEN